MRPPVSKTRRRGPFERGKRDHSEREVAGTERPDEHARRDRVPCGAGQAIGGCDERDPDARSTG
jgi:hypothetical protein